jgi:hypothetical protein
LFLVPAEFGAVNWVPAEGTERAKFRGAPQIPELARGVIGAMPFQAVF